MPTAMRWALAAAALGAVSLALVLYWQLHGLDYSGPDRPTLAPGEFDLLLTARALAAGSYLPLWAGSVHPDAIGTYLGAIEVALLLKLGLGDVASLKLCGLAHFALLCGAATGLTARLGGHRAAALTMAFLVLGAPALLGAHGRFLATTTEVIGLQIALLWWLSELVRHHRDHTAVIAQTIGCGLLLGTSVAYSSHSLWLVLFALTFWLLEARPGRKLSGAGWLLGAILLASLPWKAAAGVPGLESPGWTLKSIPVTTILAGFGFDDLLILVRELPFALLDSYRLADAESPLRWLHAGWMAAVLAALCWTLVSRGRNSLRGPHRPLDGLLAIYAAGAFAPMLFAGDLAGYPAAYRYSFNCIAVAAILLGLRYVDLERVLAIRSPRLGSPLLKVLVGGALGLGLLSLPAATTFELSPRQAAFFAGQHRLLLLDEDPHRHFRLFDSSLEPGEKKAWLQGYGMLIGEEFGIRLHQEPNGDGMLPTLEADKLVQVAETGLSQEESCNFFVGLGLGVTLDGRISHHDIELIRSVPGSQLRNFWFGVGAALGELSYWSGSAAAIIIDGGPPALGTSVPERSDVTEGYQQISGAQRRGVDGLLPFVEPAPVAQDSGPPRSLSLPHPFIFTRIAQNERGEFK